MLDKAMKGELAIKGSEKRAARLLNDFLKSHGHSSSFISGDDPPDAVFTVDGTAWDVEITELHPYIEVGGKNKSRTGFEVDMAKIIDKIKTETEKNRKKGYKIELMGPFTPHEKKQIYDQCIQLIQEGFVGEKDFFNNGKCIFKSMEDPKKNIRGFIGLHGTTKGPKGKMLADIGASIDYSVAKAIKDKNIRFVGLGGENKKVLLMYSKHFFAEPQNISKAVENNLPSDSPINEIYLVWNGKVAKIFARGIT